MAFEIQLSNKKHSLFSHTFLICGIHPLLEIVTAIVAIGLMLPKIFTFHVSSQNTT